jgi:hypothetical protein
VARRSRRFRERQRTGNVGGKTFVKQVWKRLGDRLEVLRRR